MAKNFSREAAGDEVILEFSGVEGIPMDCEVILIDRKLDQRIDLRKEPRYAFFQGKRDHVTRDEDARFALLVGSEEFIHEHEEEVPKPPVKTVLHQNHPNPFNPSTIIQYDLAELGHVTLRIYDLRGALVRTLEDRDRLPGRYEVGWNGENDRGERVAAGVYFYRLTAPGYSQTRKLVLVR